AAVAAAAVGCQDGHPDAALASPVATAAARSVAHQCGCVFCPCHYDTEQLMAQTVEKQSYEASPPYTSAVADHQMCFGKTPPSSGGLPQAPATVPPVASTVGPVSRFALNSAAAAAPTTADVGAGGCNGHI
ncbi:hypothetical protein Agub_g14606, partial [Astrephomene gubernaculifera]